MPDGNNLTIDFNDASFDTSNGDVQPGGSDFNVDVVFPLDDNPDLTVGSGASDNRASSAAPASAIALMPTDGMSSSMEEFLFEFDNDLNDDGPGTDQGLKVTTSGGSGGQQVVNEINLNGTFENLHTDGSLDIYVSDKDASGNQVFEKVTLGEGSDTSGNDNITYVGGDTNGGNTGAGDDIASINVDASATMGGIFSGGSGYDMIKLVEGVSEDSGANADFTSGLTGPNSAFVTPFGGVGDNMAFDIDEFESIQLTDNADVIIIGSETGASLTDTYDAAYLNGGGSNDMMKVQTGFTDGGMADVMYVHADSNVYLSFEFANESGLGVEATFGANGDVDVDGHIHGSASDVGTDGEVIEVDVNQSGGAGSTTIDYFEATNNHDMITNLGDIGIIVDLGGSAGMADVFTGSSTSDNDVLDAREAHSLEFAEGANGYIQVTGESEVTGSKGVIVNAELKDVDFIMVRDASPADAVDFYQDMSGLNGKQVISGLGDGATDAYGVGYDVVTSAQVDTFGSGSDMRVYYEGKHSDFVDTDDIVLGTEGVFDMSDSKSDRGSNWEGEVLSQYGPGQDPGFYIEVSGKKLAVTFDEEKGANGEWKVDSSALKVAEGVDTITTPSDPDQFASDVMARYGLKPAASVQQSTSEQGTSGGGFPVVKFSGSSPSGSGTIGHNGEKWVVDFTFGSYTVANHEVNSIGEANMFIELAHKIPLDSLTVTSTESESPVFNGTSWPSPADWGTYLSNNSGASGGSGSTAASQEANHSFSDDIYLNATEEAITELLATGTASDKSFNFGFYTKMDLMTDNGMVTVNLKLNESVSNSAYEIHMANTPVLAEEIPEIVQEVYSGSDLAGELINVVDSQPTDKDYYYGNKIISEGYTSPSGVIRETVTLNTDEIYGVYTGEEINSYFDSARSLAYNSNSNTSYALFPDPIKGESGHIMAIRVNPDTGAIHGSSVPMAMVNGTIRGINNLNTETDGLPVNGSLSAIGPFSAEAVFQPLSSGSLYNIIENANGTYSAEQSGTPGLIPLVAPTVTTNFYNPSDLQVMTGIKADTSGSFSLPPTSIAYELVDGGSSVLRINMYDAADNYKLLDTNIPINNPLTLNYSEVVGYMSNNVAHSITGSVEAGLETLLGSSADYTSTVAATNNPLDVTNSAEYIVTTDTNGNMTAQLAVSGVAQGPVLQLETTTGSLGDLTSTSYTIQQKVDAVTQTDVNNHIANAPSATYNFDLDASDIDVAVESFYNVAEDAGAGVTSSSAAGEFVKIDNSADIALGNGGDDTYVVGADSGIYGGVALEYGNIGVRGGLTASIDAVNINSVDSVEDLTFRRGKHRSEEEGNTLFIGDGNGEETVLFDNYNEYLDFRRVEYLTVEDGANNNEIFEIVTNNNLQDWDNEIYVADGGQTNIELGGLDYVIGSTKADEFVIDLSDLIGEGKSGTVNLSGIDASDTIKVNDDGALGNADEAELAATLSAAVTGVASTDGEATISFSYSNDKLTLNVDTAMDELDIINREFDHLASS